MVYNYSEIDNKVKWLTLKNIPGLGPYRIKNLLEKCGNINTIYSYLLNTKFKNQYSKNAKEYLENFNDMDRVKSILTKADELGIKLVTIDDPLYPKNLRNTKNPPCVLYYKGDLNNISKRSLALVGRVDPSEMGVKRALKFAQLCAHNNIQVISGLARGIDTIAHKGAIQFKINTYAVVGHGLDYMFPPENENLYKLIEQIGAVISQFDIGLGPKPWTFPKRNEVMCALSSGTVIIEGKEGCGSIIQAEFSFKHGRPVFLLKSNLESNDNEWAKKLVKKGAIVVEDFDTVLEKMENYNFELPKRFENKQLTLLNKSCMSSKAIIFDLDGVLFDAKNLMIKAYKEAIKKIKGYEPNINQIECIITKSPYKVFKEFNIDGRKGNYVYKKIYENLINSEASTFDNIKNIIDYFYKNGYKLGIVTTQPRKRLDIIMHKLNISKYFDITISWNDVPKGKHKPHPEGIFKTIEKLGVNKNNVCYVGDTKKDIVAAQKAGIKSIAVTWGLGNIKDLELMKPTMIIETPLELKKIESIIY